MNKPLDVLKQYWGYSAFRPLQEDIVNAVAQGKDVLALLPTGGGKSICFQVPGLMRDKGITLVISPLIALMNDQVYQLKKRGISAATIHSGMPFREIDITLDNAVSGAYRFLYVSPERLQTPLFQERCKQMSLSLIAVDEAHCISQWGYDFRPQYLAISDIRDDVTRVPIIALTATATHEVREDIAEKLKLRSPEIFVKSFERSNLIYGAREVAVKLTKLVEMLSRIKGSAIVYVRSRKKTQEISRQLQRHGITATYYHGGLDHTSREKQQNMWIQSKVQVMVATNAFGMGIDKPDVRMVIHVDLPETLEDYYQEAGRAGRDEKTAFAFILYNQTDLKQLNDRINRANPSMDEIRHVYQCLGNYLKVATGVQGKDAYPLDVPAFAGVYKLDVSQTYYVLKKLHDQGVIFLNEGFGRRSRFMFAIPHEKVYEYELFHRGMEVLIKTMLRLYGGDLYHDFVSVDEFAIAKHAGVHVNQVKKHLTQLNKEEVAIYEPVFDQPTVTFINQRYEATHLPIEANLIRQRRELALAKAQKVIEYCPLTTSCRVQYLLAYFGEEKQEVCGYCDNCKAEKNKPEVNEENIIQLIQSESHSVSSLLEHFAGHEKEVSFHLRRLLERGKIIREGDKLRA